MRRHYDAETLALYGEGEITSGKQARIRSHLAACDRCARLGADLTEVSGLLASTPAPPMPEHLAERIMLALASESAARAPSPAPADRLAADRSAGDRHGAASRAAAGDAGDAGPAHIPGRPDLPERARHRASRRWRGLSSPLVLRTLAATGAVIVIAGAGFLLANGQSAQQKSSNTSSGAGHVAAPAARPTAAPSGQPAAAAPAPAEVHYQLDGKSETATALATHTDFTRTSLDAQVTKRVKSSSSFATMAPEGSANSSVSLPGISVLDLGKCLTRISAGRKVLLADVAQYVGKPAIIIVLRPLSAVGVFDVSVVGLACSATKSDVITTAKVPSG